MEVGWYIFPALAGTILGTILCLLFTRPARPAWVLAAGLYFALDAVIVLKAPPIPGTSWNWSGKLLSAIFGLAIFFALRLSREEVGFVLPRTRSSWCWSIFGIAAAMVFDGTLNFVFRDHKVAGIEAILYQATMPGFSEELAYRGIGFALIQRAFEIAGERWKRVPPIVIPSLVFGLSHGYSRDNGTSHFVWIPFLFSLILGFWFAWIRLRSGSLLGPVLAHNSANTAGSWLSGLR